MREATDIHVLVVDDEEALRKIIKMNLEMEDFKVSAAGSAEEALQIVMKDKVDFVISDIRMPGGDGMSLLEAIRQRFPSLPTVLLVTGGSQYSRQDCISKGALEMLMKPPDMDLIIALIKQTVRGP